MFIAQQLRQTNRAELLLYLWQVEDIIRAYQADLDKLKAGYLTRFDVQDDARAQLEEWYGNLCRMMREENKLQKGHLQVVENVLIGLKDKHDELLDDEENSLYREQYYRILPFIVELRAKHGQDAPADEIRTCFEFLYGLMLLKLQNKPVSDDTRKAAAEISALLKFLA